MSYKYYDNNYEQFLNSISSANMNYLLTKFLSFIKAEGRVLDAGCGTGRDSLSMLELGYKVEAFDASIKMCEIATNSTGLNVKHDFFETVEYEEKYFDGIWASASLLHVSREKMTEVINKLGSFLKDDGVLYVSYKLRDEDFEKDERSFTCYTLESFIELIKETNLKIKEIEITSDTRNGRSEEKWLNAFLIK